MNRMVMNPAGFTFSDGTHLPCGSYVAAATYATHHDAAHYENAEVFDGFRFARMRDAVGDNGKFQMVTPDATYISFGLGRHACPGVRFLLA
jgi:cytochrome P450